jgi:hypothetical protein
MFDHSRRLYHRSVEDAIKQIRGGSRISSWREGDALKKMAPFCFFMYNIH